MCNTSIVQCSYLSTKLFYDFPHSLIKYFTTSSKQSDFYSFMERENMHCITLVKRYNFDNLVEIDISKNIKQSIKMANKEVNKVS